MMKKWVQAALSIAGYKLVPANRFNSFSEKGFFDELYCISNNKKIMLNVGAGRFRHSDWRNVDLKVSSLSIGWSDQDINHDLLSHTVLPFLDDTVDAIYSSHVMEHIPQDAVDFFFTDAKRMLKPGAVMRISVPNTDLAINSFLRGDKRFFEEFYSERLKDTSLNNLLVRYVATQAVDPEFTGNSLHNIEQLNNMNYDEILVFLSELCEKCDLEYQALNFMDHVNWFTEKKLIDTFKKSGFKNVQVSGFGQSRLPHLRDTRMFDKTLSQVSLYVEGEA
ncbi:MAG: putative SAM-dependent methyltransferase [Paracoccaceae bacterium]|jgi:predicted SAM-dependent methyltransferase